MVKVVPEMKSATEKRSQLGKSRSRTKERNGGKVTT